MPSLPRDRVVIVTGASAGIGRETALAFAKDGARLVIASRNGQRLAGVGRQINEIGGQCIAKQADITKRSEIRSLVGIAQKKWGAVHVLVNNAGIGFYGPVESMEDADFDALMRTNVLGAIHAIQEVLPLMKEQRCGQIINVSSTLGRAGLPLMSVYCMTKFALEALSQSLRVELKPHGIDVIVVAPGVTATEFNYNARVRGLAKNPASSIEAKATPDKVARAILKASRRRKREVVLNLESKAFLALRAIAPSLTDWGLGRWMKTRMDAPGPDPGPGGAP